ncbi:MAG TPA: hypothetical protein VN087_11615 [Verrucomicrobiae bacterium]|nr:hypothetical protein [Verrucomicrobiae bacterium]
MNFQKNARSSPAIVLTVLAVLFVFFMTGVSAQESSSDSSVPPTSPNGPSAALRDVLMAACSQSQNDFARFLTARNKEAFNRMAPTARVAFMKRFVLLNEAGKPSVTANPSGRPIVRCDTPAGAAEIQIGGADTRDNVAFMPVQLRDATDTTNASAIQVNMGLVRENGEWKILSLGVVLLDLPSLELEWDSAEADKNELAAVESLKDIADAVENFRRKYTRLPASLSSLGPPLRGPASADAAQLLDSDLAAGMKNGYSFRYVIVGASGLGAPAKYELAATPLSYGRTGHRSFFRDGEGTLRAADRQGAVGSASDPRMPEH